MRRVLSTGRQGNKEKLEMQETQKGEGREERERERERGFCPTYSELEVTTVHRRSLKSSF